MNTGYLQYGDDELLSLLASGEREAFETIYHRHWEALFDTAYSILREREASKDIVQDIFIWLWEKRSQLSIKILRHYLRAAVKFKVANFIRNGNIRESFYEDIVKLQPAQDAQNPLEQAELQELLAVIRDAIDSLPPKCREIYLLKREERLTNPQISERLHVSVKTVENQITIAQRRIRSSVDPYLSGLLLASASIFI